MPLDYAPLRIGEYLSMGSDDSDDAVRLTAKSGYTGNLVTLIGNAGHDAQMLQVSHYGTVGFGVNVSNFPGASAGLVIHQYSNNGAGVILDNTDSAPMIRINNTENAERNPGGVGTGQFVLVEDHGTDLAAWQASGDIEWFSDAIGPVLLDRTSGSRYRVYVDGGALAVEAVA